MKTLLVTALLFGSSVAMAEESEKSLFEISVPHMTKFAAQVQAENQTMAVKSLLDILESDRPSRKAWGVKSEGRDLKAEAGEGSKTL